MQAPIYSALTQQLLIAGVPREVAILNGTITAALLFGLNSFSGLLAGALIHGAFRIATTYDEQCFSVLKRALKQPTIYVG